MTAAEPARAQEAAAPARAEQVAAPERAGAARPAGDEARRLWTGMLSVAAAASAAAAVLLYHAVVFWIPALIGTAAYLRLRATLGEPVAAPAPHGA